MLDLIASHKNEDLKTYIEERPLQEMAHFCADNDTLLTLCHHAIDHDNAPVLYGFLSMCPTSISRRSLIQKEHPDTRKNMLERACDMNSRSVLKAIMDYFTHSDWVVRTIIQSAHTKMTFLEYCCSKSDLEDMYIMCIEKMRDELSYAALQEFHKKLYGYSLKKCFIHNKSMFKRLMMRPEVKEHPIFLSIDTKQIVLLLQDCINNKDYQVLGRCIQYVDSGKLFKALKSVDKNTGYNLITYIALSGSYPVLVDTLKMFSLDDVYALLCAHNKDKKGLIDILSQGGNLYQREITYLYNNYIKKA
jgi:hypothetical protein